MSRQNQINRGAVILFALEKARLGDRAVVTLGDRPGQIVIKFNRQKFLKERPNGALLKELLASEEEFLWPVDELPGRMARMRKGRIDLLSPEESKKLEQKARAAGLIE